MGFHSSLGYREEGKLARQNYFLINYLGLLLVHYAHCASCPPYQKKVHRRTRYAVWFLGIILYAMGCALCAHLETATFLSMIAKLRRQEYLLAHAFLLISPLDFSFFLN